MYEGEEDEEDDYFFNMLSPLSNVEGIYLDLYQRGRDLSGSVPIRVLRQDMVMCYVYSIQM